MYESYDLDPIRRYAIKQQKLAAAKPVAQPAQPTDAKISINNPLPAFDGLRSIDATINYKDGRPERNPYVSMTDRDGKLLSQFSMAGKIGNDVQLDRTAMNALQSRATSQGPSAWAQMATQNQRNEQQNAMNAANRNSMAQQNRQYGMLAGRGGLSAGQRERMAMQGARGAFGATQNIANQGMQQRLGIGMQDDQQKLGLLQQLPGMQMNAANFDQSQRAYRNNATNADLANAMKDIQGFNAYNAGAYSDAMKEWGALESSKAQAKAAGSGGKK